MWTHVTLETLDWSPLGEVHGLLSLTSYSSLTAWWGQSLWDQPGLRCEAALLLWCFLILVFTEKHFQTSKNRDTIQWFYRKTFKHQPKKRSFARNLIDRSSQEAKLYGVHGFSTVELKGVRSLTHPSPSGPGGFSPVWSHFWLRVSTPSRLV